VFDFEILPTDAFVWVIVKPPIAVASAAFSFEFLCVCSFPTDVVDPRSRAVFDFEVCFDEPMYR